MSKYSYTGKIRDIQLDFESRKPIISIELNEKNDFFENADELRKCEKLDIDLKKHSAKRSLSANSYAWVLLDKLAERLSIPRETIYRDLIRNVGGNSSVISIPTAECDKLLDSWQRNGLGWFGEILTQKSDFSEVALYYGSSTFDTKQMSRFIELIIQECRDEEIATDTLERLAYLEGLLEQ